MNGKSYTLRPDEKASQVMVGTDHALIWGDLVTKEGVRLSVFLNTLAEDFVPLHDVKILFLAPTQQVSPKERASLHVKLEEITLFFVLDDPEPLPDEPETQRYEPMEVIGGSYHVEGKILKAPMATLENMLLVSRSAYMPVYEATIRHVAKPWLGTFSGSRVQVRRDKMMISPQ
jgi:hypothetical protein